jgi:hypothetical protein
MWIETTETDRLHLHGQKRCLCFMPSLGHFNLSFQETVHPHFFLLSMQRAGKFPRIITFSSSSPTKSTFATLAGVIAGQRCSLPVLLVDHTRWEVFDVALGRSLYGSYLWEQRAGGGLTGLWRECKFTKCSKCDPTRHCPHLRTSSGDSHLSCSQVVITEFQSFLYCSRGMLILVFLMA